MRFLARLGLGLCGLALVTSAVVKADDPAAPPSNAVVPQAAQVAGHHHKGLFGWRHCVECQRAYAKKRDGVDVPPPPSTAAAAAMAGTIVHDHNHGAPCAACQGGHCRERAGERRGVISSGSCGGGWAGHGRQPSARICRRGRRRAKAGGCGPRPGWRFAGSSEPMEQPSARLDAAAGGRRAF